MAHSAHCEFSFDPTVEELDFSVSAKKALKERSIGRLGDLARKPDAELHGFLANLSCQHRREVRQMLSEHPELMVVSAPRREFLGTASFNEIRSRLLSLVERETGHEHTQHLYDEFTEALEEMFNRGKSAAKAN